MRPSFAKPSTRGWLSLALGGMLLASCGAPNPNPSGVSQLPARSASPTTAVSATRLPTPSAIPTPSATPVPTPKPTWQPAAQLGKPGTWTTVLGIAHGSRGYLAYGHQAPLNESGVATGSGRNVMWLSDDALSWHRTPIPARIRFAEVRGVLVASNGAFVLFANGSPAFAAVRHYVIYSADGRHHWTAASLDQQQYGVIAKAVTWGKGYAFLEPLARSPARLFNSKSGLAWHEGLYYHAGTYQTTIYDIGGGDEGMVMLGHRILSSGQQFEIATATSTGARDEWAERRNPFGKVTAAATRLTSLGPDWVAVRRQADGTAQFWTSANGLDWTATGTVRRSTRVGPGDALFTVGDMVYFAPGSERALFPYQKSGPTWSSGDGATWRRLALPPGATVTSGIAYDGGTLLAGVDGDGRGTFWVAP